MHPAAESAIVRRGRVRAWPLPHLSPAPPFQGLALEVRLVFSAQHAVDLVHVSEAAQTRLRSRCGAVALR
jgi:hypothetical protein